jgi:hypothetical protein
MSAVITTFEPCPVVQEFLCKQCQFKAGYAGPGWCYMFVDMFIDCAQRLPVVYPPYAAATSNAAQQANGADAEQTARLAEEKPLNKI